MFTGQIKKDYQREYMRKKRAGLTTGLTTGLTGSNKRPKIPGLIMRGNKIMGIVKPPCEPNIINPCEPRIINPCEPRIIELDMDGHPIPDY